jgi:hypothetical protein
MWRLTTADKQLLVFPISSRYTDVDYRHAAQYSMPPLDGLEKGSNRTLG